MSHNFYVIAIWSSTRPIYPRDLLRFKTTPKRLSLAANAADPFFLAFSIEFYDSKFLRCSLKSERIHAKRAIQPWKTTFQKRADRIILLERSYGPQTLKLYEPLQAFRISFRTRRCDVFRFGLRSATLKFQIVSSSPVSLDRFLRFKKNFPPNKFQSKNRN